MDHSIAKKYELEKRLGKGAYGIVWKAKSIRSGRVVAVKKIFDAFRNKTDAQRTFREISFLKAFSDHPNIIKLLNVHRAENDRDLYLVFEFMNTDLHHVIRKGNILQEVHKRYIMYQLFRATQYLHSGNVIHRDQKPSNILLDCECNCKMADFGLARSLTTLQEDADPADQGCLTEYVATRWYRAPEILLGSKNYTKGVDLWSLGCILGEILMEKPLFPGKSTGDQIDRIYGTMNFKRVPSEKAAPLPPPGSAAAATSSTSKPAELKSLLKGCNADEDASQLLQALLRFDPKQRITAEQALSHEYVSRFHTDRAVRSVKENVVPALSDDIQLSVDQYRDKLYEMIRAQKAKAVSRSAEKDKRVLK